MGLALLVGRVSGLVRETVVASIFGISAQGDLAVVLMTLPDLMVNLLVAGGLSAAFVPSLLKLPPDEADILTRFVAIVTLSLFTIFGLIVFIAPDITVGILAPGRADLGFMLTGWLPFLIAVALPIAAFSGVAGGYANARGHFFVSGIGTLLFNVTLISILLLGLHMPPLQALALGIFLGAVMRGLPLFLHIPSRLFRSRLLVPQNWRGFLVDFCAGLLAVGSALLAPVVLRAAASWLEGGSVSALNYAQKLVELPVGVILSAVSIVSLTAMSKAHAKGGAQSASRVAVDHMRVAFMLASLAMVGSIGFAKPVTEIAFGYGKMGPQDLSLVAGLFAYGACSIPFAAVSLLGTNYLYATNRAITAFWITAGALLTLVPIIYLAWEARSLSLLMVGFTMYQIVLAVLVLVWSGLPVMKQGAHQGHPLIDRRIIGQTALAVLPIAAASAVQFLFLPDAPILSLAVAGFGFLLGLVAIAYFEKRYV
ncbi:murein biosynthesis integral membrane protein MurJ [Sphingorhabdus sp.]|uniref:murein biosynthesis integral membrane protein MurJ n=1 Tax=Sphingorhabdus sp. TaxID=1902408 RepID=UPI0039196DB0